MCPQSPRPIGRRQVAPPTYPHASRPAPSLEFVPTASGSVPLPRDPCHYLGIHAATSGSMPTASGSVLATSGSGRYYSRSGHWSKPESGCYSNRARLGPNLARITATQLDLKKKYKFLTKLVKKIFAKLGCGSSEDSDLGRNFFSNVVFQVFFISLY